MKLLYIYSGARKNRYQGILGKDYPDTRFQGLNHMKEFGIDAEYLEWSDIAPIWVKKIIGFRLQHLFMFFASRKYDVVFGSSVLYMMIFKKLFPTKTKYVLFNTSLIRTIYANKGQPFRYRLILIFMKTLDGIICPATSQKIWLESNFPSMRGKVFFVPLGVDIDFYKPIFAERQKYVLSVGYDIGRDYETLMRVAERLPAIKFKVVCHPLNIKKIKKIPSNVEIFHDTPFDDLNQMYKSAGAVVITTQDDRPEFGSNCSGQTALLDAMASGLPIIITRQACLDDYVSNGKEVYLVEPYDDAKIADLVTKQMSGNLDDFAKEARQKVESLSTRDMAKELAEVLKKLA